MTSQTSPTTGTGGESQELVMKVPTPVFFLPLVLGTVLVFVFERVLHLETILETICSQRNKETSPMALMGLAIFCLEVLQRWMSGLVNHARWDYQVPVPTLYVTKSENKYANEYNARQRCHHNFLETYPQLLAGAYMTALVVNRPYTAGFVLLVIALLRVFYTLGYQRNVKDRGGFFLLSIILGEVLTIYSLAAAMPMLFGIQLFGI